MTRSLDDLFAFLDGLDGPPELAQLTAALARLDVECDDVAEHVRFADRTYARNPVRSGPRYQAWVMCWKNGQRSPIHDHTGSSCGVRVLRGTADRDPLRVRPQRPRQGDRLRATCSAGQRLRQPGRRPAPDLQPPGRQRRPGHPARLLAAAAAMGTYSLTRRRPAARTSGSRNARSSPPSPRTARRRWRASTAGSRPTGSSSSATTSTCPTIDRAAWRLRVEGCVERPLRADLGRADGPAAAQRLRHGRVRRQRPLVPAERPPGVQWGAGAIGHAEWTGVPLRRVLEQAGLKPGALEVAVRGGRPRQRGRPPRADALRPQPAAGQGPRPRHAAGLPHERRAARRRATASRCGCSCRAGTASPRSNGCSGIEVDRPAVPRLLPDRQVHGPAREPRTASETVVVGPMAVKSEIVRPAGRASAGPGHQPAVRRRLGRRGGGGRRRGQHRRRPDLERRPTLLGPQAPYSLDAVGVPVGGGRAGRLHAAGAGDRRPAAGCSRPSTTRSTAAT